MLEMMKGITFAGVAVFVLGGLLLFILWSRDQSTKL